jgi:hypothetical protein
MFESYRQMLGPVFQYPDVFKLTKGELKVFQTFRGEKRQGIHSIGVPVLAPPPKKKTTSKSRAIVRAESGQAGGDPSTGNEDNNEQMLVDLTKENGGL